MQKKLKKKKKLKRTPLEWLQKLQYFCSKTVRQAFILKDFNVAHYRRVRAQTQPLHCCLLHSLCHRRRRPLFHLFFSFLFLQSFQYFNTFHSNCSFKCRWLLVGTVVKEPRTWKQNTDITLKIESLIVTCFLNFTIQLHIHDLKD